MTQHSPEIQKLLYDAAKAEEYFDLDELEYFALQYRKSNRTSKINEDIRSS
jgi:hypothetical protein